MAFFALFSFVGYAWFANTEYFSYVIEWAQENSSLFLIFLFVFKFIGIVWPPIAGGILTISAIPIIGWQSAYLIDLSGSIAGGTLSYYLGYKYGEKFLKKFFDKNVIDKIKNLKIKKDRELEALLVYRVLFGFTIIEAIYYGAGLLKVGFKNFFVAAVISHLAIGIPTFYFLNNVFSGGSVVVAAVSLMIAIPFFLRFKSRYFE